MKRAILSDCHAGQGESNSDLRQQIQHAVARGAEYIGECGARIDMLLGDTVHHLGNVLQAAQTRRDISLEQLAPLADLLRQQDAPASAIAGNTDWLLSATDNLDAAQKLWLEYTGFDPRTIVFPESGLCDSREVAGTHLFLTHGHAFDRKQRGDAHRPRSSDYPRLLDDLYLPASDFITKISDPNGPHAVSTNRMATVGKYVKKLPDFIRPSVADAVGWVMKTREFEPEFARLMTLSGVAQETRLRCVGVMGHSHIAGIRRYGSQTIVNTGSFGARNIPSQRVSDQKAHVVIVDDEAPTLELVRTYDPRHPDRKPKTIGMLNLEA